MGLALGFVKCIIPTLNVTFTLTDLLLAAILAVSVYLAVQLT